MSSNRYSPEQRAKQARTEARWRTVMDDWKASGLDGRSYAKLKGISEHVFYSWKRTIRLRDEKQTKAKRFRSAAVGAGRKPRRDASRGRKSTSDSKHRPPDTKKPPLFLPVSVKSSGSLELRHASGHTLVAHEGCSPELLRLMLEALS